MGRSKWSGGGWVSDPGNINKAKEKAEEAAKKRKKQAAERKAVSKKKAESARSEAKRRAKRRDPLKRGSFASEDAKKQALMDMDRKEKANRGKDALKKGHFKSEIAPSERHKEREVVEEQKEAQKTKIAEKTRTTGGKARQVMEEHIEPYTKQLEALAKKRRRKQMPGAEDMYDYKSKWYS